MHLKLPQSMRSSRYLRQGIFGFTRSRTHVVWHDLRCVNEPTIRKCSLIVVLSFTSSIALIFIPNYVMPRCIHDKKLHCAVILDVFILCLTHNALSQIKQNYSTLSAPSSTIIITNEDKIGASSHIQNYSNLKFFLSFTRLEWDL